MKSAPAFLLAIGLAVAASPAPSADRIVVVAGGGTDTNSTAPLRALDARLNGPFGVDFDSEGNLYLVEMPATRVRKLDPGGNLSVIAGTGEKGGRNGPALSAQFNGLHSLAVFSDQIFVADTWNNQVRVVFLANGTVKPGIGTGEKGFSGDGHDARAAKFGGIYCVSVGGDQQFYLADLDNLRIRALDPKTGRVRTVAGNGTKGVPTDGAQAVDAPLLDPRAVIADALGRVYILERGGNALRMVDTNGAIRTIAGTGAKGFSGDGGSARDATMNGPKHLCFDLDGSVLIADTENHAVRRYTPRDGKINRVAGTGKRGSRGAGASPLECELNQPHGVTLRRDGTIYICDSSNNRVLRIEK
jgi:DNA-binding beta-propeller fold protein YncE